VLKHEGKLLHEIDPPGMADVEVLLGIYVAQRVMICVEHKLPMDEVVPPMLERLYEGIKF
jgi:hypothetical protein